VVDRICTYELHDTSGNQQVRQQLAGCSHVPTDRPRQGDRARTVMTASMTEVQFTAAITHEGDWYVARCLQVEVASQGESVESALANLREALELYFEDELLPVDMQAPIIAPVEVTV